MGSVFTCKFNPCCGDRYNCEPPRQYFDPEPAPALASVAPSGAEPTQAIPSEDVIAKSKVLELLKRLEWSATRQGSGSGYMGSGGDGRYYPACPECGGIKDSPESRGEFINSAIGHKPSCELRSAIYASPQAVPAEDVAGLIAATEAELAAGSLSAMDWNTRSIALVRRLLAALTSLSAERDEAQRQRDHYRFSPQGDNHHNALKCPYCNPGLIDWQARATASEAEATSLRSKLEEHRRVLAEASERINRYADTAAEHDLVARIDALSGASE